MLGGVNGYSIFRTVLFLLFMGMITLYHSFYGVNYTIVSLLVVSLASLLMLTVECCYKSPLCKIFLTSCVLISTSVVFVFVPYLIDKIGNDKLQKSYQLMSVVDRSILSKDMEDLTLAPLQKIKSVQPERIVKCKKILDQNYSKISDLIYGECTFWEPVIQKEYDPLWWFELHRIVIEFPLEAYNIPWVKRKLDAVINDPCSLVLENESPWETLGCNKSLKQNLTILLILVNDSEVPVKRKWFYRYRWESWFP